MRASNRGQGTSRREPRFLLRIPAQLLSHIDAAARASYRTRTAEVIRRLEESVKNESIEEHGVIVRFGPSENK